MKVRERMSSEVETLGRNDELRLADDIVTMKRLRHLPVLDGGRLVGILTQRDLRRSPGRNRACNTFVWRSDRARSRR